MKKIKWKILIITNVVCLLSMLFGLALWNELPEVMAIHFNVYGVADGFAPKAFVVFGLPLLMAVFQTICCVVSDISMYKNGESDKLVTISKWIVPSVTVVLQIATLGYSIGWNLDIRRIAAVIVGILFLVTGNYMPKVKRVNNSDVDGQKSRKFNRFLGYETVIMGLLFLISAFLEPIYMIICLFLMIPHVIIALIYGAIISKK